MKARLITVTAAALLSATLGACAIAPADPAAVRARLPAISSPKHFCMSLVQAQNVADLSGEREVRYVSCVADPDPFLWNYAAPNVALFNAVIRQRSRVEDIARAVIKGNS
jgi:hypothetical protein